MPTSTVEDYLKCIYLESRHAPEELVSTGRIAGAMRVAPVAHLREAGATPILLETSFSSRRRQPKRLRVSGVWVFKTQISFHVVHFRQPTVAFLPRLADCKH